MSPPRSVFPAGSWFDDLKAHGAEALYFEDTSAIIEYLGRTAREGDVIAVLSNGGFDNIHARLLERLRQVKEAGLTVICFPPQHLRAGVGSVGVVTRKAPGLHIGLGMMCCRSPCHGRSYRFL